jgi:mono/diheme cytochrome c family protein
MCARASRTVSAPRGPDGPIAVALIASLMACLAAAAAPRNSSTTADAGAGRHFALRACTGCHIVSPDQPFAPLIDRTPMPPDFAAIANKSNTTPQSLRRYFASLRPVPPPGQMADPYLTERDRENIIAFIMTLRQAH